MRKARAPPRIPPIAPAARMIPHEVAPPRSRWLTTGPRTRKVAIPSTVTGQGEPRSHPAPRPRRARALRELGEERAGLRALRRRDREHGEKGSARDEGQGVDGEDP